MSNNISNQEKKYNRIITILSIVIPLAVALLFGVNLKSLGFDVEPLTFLPPIYASINGFTALLLIGAVILVSRNIILSLIFCTIYVILL